MFRVKICGVTRPADAIAAADAGADAIGLNFYSKSKRCVGLPSASEIARSVSGGPLVVGVFVNATPEFIREAVDAAALGAIQLHGDEDPSFPLSLPTDTPVIRAVRMTESGLARQAADQAELDGSGRPYAAFLVDAAGGPSAYGGTGRLADWDLFRAEKPRIAPTPAVLAGGLTADNVSAAIAATSCDGVDTASGVESSPGVKDGELVRRFVDEARNAFAGAG